MDIDHCEKAYLPDKAMGYDPYASILRAPDLSRLPPAYVATAGFDPIRDEAEEYATRMRAEGTKVALRRHPRLTHIFANLTDISPLLPGGDAGDGRGAAHGPLALAARRSRRLLVVQRLEHVEARSAPGGQDRGEDPGEDRDDHAGRPASRPARRGRSLGP